MQKYIIALAELGADDVGRVGGKNSSLGELISQLSGLGVKVPGGFATTADAFIEFLDYNKLRQRIHDALSTLDINDVKTLALTGKKIRQWILEAAFPPALETEISHAFHAFAGDENMAVAVRSSATAEDLPEASFAGQQETFLNIRGLDNVLTAIREVFASLYNDRAISYREHRNFEHRDVALSVGVQRMVRSETASSGVMFTLDTESGFDDVVFITSSWGLGESVVQGAVNPDEFYLYKPNIAANKSAMLRRNLGSKKSKMVYGKTAAAGSSVETVPVSEKEQQSFSITDEEAIELSRQAILIEQHYKRPMDIEWAKDGDTGDLFIVQARPETVKSRSRHLERYHLLERGEVLIEGRSIGQRIGSGVVRNLTDISEMDRLNRGDVLVTDMTDPDWEPVMKLASAIVTNRGGRTCHAAIIAREMGIPAVVGCTDATSVLKEDQEVTVSCAEGDIGFVYRGKLPFEVKCHTIEKMPEIPLKIMMNVGNPDRAFDFSRLPNNGVGLARLEFIINQMIGIHPKALLEFDSLSDKALKEKIQIKTAGFSDPVEYYIRRLTEGIATIGAAFSPERVIVRMSDFKSNEYANLLGGNIYEPHEENPMLGFRGASRYVSTTFRDCFELECQALNRVRMEMGLTNVDVMIPFVRTVNEAKKVVDLLKENGLLSGDNGLRIIMMCELPTNALLAGEYLQYFDGFSIGSNDMTQLTLGLDRDSGLIAESFDERDAAVKALLAMAIKACRDRGKYIGICGQGPSDHSDFAHWLVEQGIETVSLNPDTVVDTWLYLADNTQVASYDKVTLKRQAVE